MQFVVTPLRRTHDTVLGVEGELDIATARDLAAVVKDVLAEGPARLLVDLTTTSFLDSTGCRELVRTAKAGSRLDVEVAVVAPPDNWRVRRVIDFIRLAELVPVHDELPAP